jgi:UDPglucose 6-dehydrogenase
MLAQRISSINSISAICEATGADITEISRSIGLDPRIGPKFLKAGLGFGGSCFRKDIASLTYLAESLGLPEVADYWAGVNKMNELQRRRFTSRVIKQLDENLVGKKIALLGFAFKKDTGDTRESLAVDVIAQLLEERPAEISIFDPYCRADDIRREIEPVTGGGKESGSVRVYEDVYEACLSADAIMVINECDQFRCDSSETSHSSTSMPPTTTPTEPESFLLNGHSIYLKPKPTCEADCTLCSGSISSRKGAQDPVDWRKIAQGMSEPRFVFDGRCILDVVTMRELGFRVTSIGRQNV